MALDLEKMARVYIKIRDKRAELKREFDESDKNLKDQQDQIAQALLEHCKETNSNSVNTSAGTIIRSTKERYWTSDWEQFYKFVMDNNTPELLERRIAQGNIKAFLADNPDLTPKGLQADTDYTISIRRKS